MPSALIIPHLPAVQSQQRKGIQNSQQFQIYNSFKSFLGSTWLNIVLCSICSMNSSKSRLTFVCHGPKMDMDGPAILKRIEPRSVCIEQSDSKIYFGALDGKWWKHHQPLLPKKWIKMALTSAPRWVWPETSSAPAPAQAGTKCWSMLTPEKTTC